MIAGTDSLSALVSLAVPALAAAALPFGLRAVRRQAPRPPAADGRGMIDPTVERALARAAIPRIGDVFVNDPIRRRSTAIDTVAAVGDRLWVIEALPWAGTTYGREGDPYWVNRRFRRDGALRSATWQHNPLIAAEARAGALQRLATQDYRIDAAIALTLVVVFTVGDVSYHSASNSRVMVVNRREFERALARDGRRGPLPPETDAFWYLLRKEHALQDRAYLRRCHLEWNRAVPRAA